MEELVEGNAGPTLYTSCCDLSLFSYYKEQQNTISLCKVSIINWPAEFQITLILLDFICILFYYCSHETVFKIKKEKPYVEYRTSCQHFLKKWANTKKKKKKNMKRKQTVASLAGNLWKVEGEF